MNDDWYSFFNTYKENKLSNDEKISLFEFVSLEKKIVMVLQDNFLSEYFSSSSSHFHSSSSMIDSYAKYYSESLSFNISPHPIETDNEIYYHKLRDPIRNISWLEKHIPENKNLSQFTTLSEKQFFILLQSGIRIRYDLINNTIVRKNPAYLHRMLEFYPDGEYVKIFIKITHQIRFPYEWVVLVFPGALTGMIYQSKKNQIEIQWIKEGRSFEELRNLFKELILEMGISEDRYGAAVLVDVNPIRERLDPTQGRLGPVPVEWRIDPSQSRIVSNPVERLPPSQSRFSRTKKSLLMDIIRHPIPLYLPEGSEDAISYQTIEGLFYKCTGKETHYFNARTIENWCENNSEIKCSVCPFDFSPLDTILYLKQNET